MSGCRPDTFALFGVDQILLGSGRAGSDGVARARITIPAALPAGPHTVSGFCLGANGLPLFLRTTIDVTPSGPPPSGTPPPPGGTSIGTGTGSGAGGTGGRAGGGRGGGTTPAASVPSADVLAAPTLPADASVLFEDAADANGVPRTPRSSGTEGAEPAASTADHAGTADVGPFSTMARVGLGLAAIFGVPVALAVSRRPRRAAPRPA